MALRPRLSPGVPLVEVWRYGTKRYIRRQDRLARLGEMGATIGALAYTGLIVRASIHGR